LKTLVFDLDDTLYPEMEFVLGGFQRVAEWLADSFSLDKKKLQASMVATLGAEGRSQIFDKILRSNGVYSASALRTCIALYRAHEPNISLNASVVETLKWAQLEFPLFLVTDGNKLVQARKVRALELEKFFQGIFITHRYGLASAKPSLRCFEKIIDTTMADWNELMYVGDNPIKDFVALNAQGAETTGIESSPYYDPSLPSSHQPKYSISQLNDLPELLSKLGWV
jgi:putative hydrolase of the HAD superfamily